MPIFDENPLQRLALQPDDADAVLDLQGLNEDQALHTVEQLLGDRGTATRYLIRFDAAAGDGRETLFLPLGRRLLEARRAGQLQRCLPSPDGAGYFIEFAD